MCEAQSDECKTCEGKNCNLKKEFQECIHCNSRQNVECSRNGIVKTSQLCTNYLSACVTGIDAHGYTQRRCSRDYIDDDVDFPNQQLEVCTENKCNTGIFPANRLQCYRCEGDIDDCDFVSTNSTEMMQLEPCSILSKFDQCFAYLAKGKSF